MTEEQIKDYEYCKIHLTTLTDMASKSPFKIQMYGCGTGDPRITFRLEAINKKMYDKIQDAIDEAKLEINEIIKEL